MPETVERIHIKETVAPGQEPISITEAKLWARIDTDDDDEILEMLIAAAREKAERFTNRSFVNRTLELAVDGQPSTTQIELPHPPIVSVSSVVSFNLSNVQSTMDAGSYNVVTNAEPGRVALNSGSSWPSSLREFDSMRVTYVAGYGESQSDVPGSIRLAMRHIVAFWYDNRGSEEMPEGARRLLSPFRIIPL